MNSAFSPEMLNCLNSNSENTSVLERRQRSRLKWQQEQMYFNGNEHLGGVFLASNDHGFGEMLLGGAMKPDPDIENGWSHDFGSSVLNYGISGFELEASYPNAIPRTVSCPPNMAAAMAEVAASKAALGKESFKKRKADRTQSLKAIAEENSREKKVKGFTEEDSKITEQSSNSKSTTTTATNSKGLPSTNNNSSKDNSKVSDAPKPDYIHVRARRGQATDSHSLAERVRREKISERMKYLQDLVPGCNKITGKAGMLDEIINYVQSLQRQVEFLSMKLAAINPRLDFDMDNYLNKEIVTASTSSIPIIGVSSEMVNSAHLQFNALDQGVLCTSLGMGVNATDLTLRRTISAPVSIAETFLDSSCLNQIQQLTWDATELQNLYNIECQHGRSTPFITQPFTGFIDSGHVKTEM